MPPKKNPKLPPSSTWGRWGSWWGIGGIVLLLGSAAWRLLWASKPAWPELLKPGYAAIALVWLLLLGYVKGYRLLGQRLVPRVVCRAHYLRQHPAPMHWWCLLAPLFCMGYFHSTRRRLCSSWGISTGIVVLVILLQHLVQPWRSIIDLGAAASLALGAVALLWQSRYLSRGLPRVSPDIPVEDGAVEVYSNLSNG